MADAPPDVVVACVDGIMEDVDPWLTQEVSEQSEAIIKGQLREAVTERIRLMLIEVVRMAQSIERK